MATLKQGDEVQWNTTRGPTRSKVTRKVTGTAKVEGHVAKASPDAPQFEVRSERSGRKAIHKPSALKKLR